MLILLYLHKIERVLKLEIKDLVGVIKDYAPVKELLKYSKGDKNFRVKVGNVCCSFPAFLVGMMYEQSDYNQFVILENKEDAAYFYNDICEFVGEENVLFLPPSYTIKRNNYKIDSTDVVLRTEVLNKLGDDSKRYIVAAWPESLLEKVIDKQGLLSNTLNVRVGDNLSSEFLEEVLVDYDFTRVDFVYEPGQYAVRGSIVDVFSFSYEDPIRLDFFGDEVDSIRFFDVENQLSKSSPEKISIVPNVQGRGEETRVDFPMFIKENTFTWLKSGRFVMDSIKSMYDNIVDYAVGDESELQLSDFVEPAVLQNRFEEMSVFEFGQSLLFEDHSVVGFDVLPQPIINKNFEVLESNLKDKSEEGWQNYILSSNPVQIDRINAIYEDKGVEVDFNPVIGVVHSGFMVPGLKIAIYTDHQIFDRYHKFKLRNSELKKNKASITLKEINTLQPGDYVVHTDHGVGRFGGLQKIEVNGNFQEAIRLVYKDNDVLFVGIHSLHKISKYKGKDSEPPKIYKLGSGAWKRLTNKTKSKVKDIARELIELYAKRKMEKAFAFSNDSYLQEELEASFIYEDTPDQYKSTVDIKKDMESSSPMDRLVCGDVGFGKTEVAIRAAFKAVADSKQVAVLVPTTILAFQHFKTFSERLKDMPCRVEYISRLRKASEVKQVLKDLEAGLVDIVIGTHRIVGKDVKFKDLGLLIVDEEQKFGVSVKEKLKRFKLNVDTLTLTATPIPRTLQFSLLGARDLSIIKTPPPNRYPVVTELHTFSNDVIKEAIEYEISRNGQVFFIHNRIENIYEVEAVINKLVPGIRTAVGHGRMDGPKLEKVMLGFMRGDYDVFIATTIIESGLDIPNANTIIINQAQNYGLSDLHQLRGRVGRSNKKAFCYLIAPPLETITSEARRRLRAIEEFSELGSGFNISMQDLDIRGAGNLLGGEQSGFINEMGYETYQRILDEALTELRQGEYKELFINEENEEDIKFVNDCQIDTDLEIVIPEDYVENIAERIKLYRELDNISNEEELKSFEGRMLDRFGEIPKCVKDLFVVVRIRWKAIDLGIEKIILKNKKMICYFVNDQESAYYQSSVFMAVLAFVQKQTIACNMKESKDKLSLVFNNVDKVEQIDEILSKVK